jgi:arylsulfatase
MEPAGAIRSPLNVLLISLDTVRAGVAYSGAFPGIELLRSRGATFATAVSSSPLTPISHATVLTGLQPPNHGIRHLMGERLKRGTPTMAKILDAAGYACAAVVSSPGMNRWYGLHRGFSAYDDWVPPLPEGRSAGKVGIEPRGTALKRAPDVTQRAVRWLRRQKERPVFLFVHYFDAHWPYQAPEVWGGEAANPYEGEVGYSDHYLGEFLSEAERLDLTPDNTLFVLFSDHGEDLAGWYPDDHAGPRGYPEERGHGTLLFDVTQLVPLVIGAPGLPRGATVNATVRLVDVLPTVLSLLRVQVPETLTLDGCSLLPFMREENESDLPAYAETYYREEVAASDPRWRHLAPLACVRTRTHKVIWEPKGSGVDVFDLVRDPHEQNPTRMVAQ